jgi:hypothetical protein
MQARQLSTWQDTTGACALTSPVLYIIRSAKLSLCQCDTVLDCHSSPRVHPIGVVRGECKAKHFS